MALRLLPGLEATDVVVSAPAGRISGRSLLLDIIGSVLGNETPKQVNCEEENLPFWAKEAWRWEVVEAASPEHLQDDSSSESSETRRYQRVIVSDLGPRVIAKDTLRAGCKVIVLMRDPVDVRANEAKDHLRMSSTEEVDERAIDGMVCHTLEGEEKDGIKSGTPPPLEYQVVRWYRTGTRGQVKFLFYEQILAEPTVVYQGLAEYLGVFNTHEYSDDEMNSILERFKASGNIQFGTGYINCSEATIARVKYLWTRRVARRLPEAITYASMYETLLSKEFPFTPSTFEFDPAPKMSRAKSKKWFMTLGRKVKSSVLMRAPSWSRGKAQAAASTNNMQRPHSSVSIFTRKLSFQSNFSDTSSFSNMSVSTRGRSSRYGRHSVERRRKPSQAKHSTLRFTDEYDDDLNRTFDAPLSTFDPDRVVIKKPSTAPARSNPSSFTFDVDEFQSSNKENDLDNQIPAPPPLSADELEELRLRMREESQQANGYDELDTVNESASGNQTGSFDDEEVDEEEDEEDLEEAYMRKFQSAQSVYENEPVFEPVKSKPILVEKPPPPSSSKPDHEPEYNPLQPLGIVLASDDEAESDAEAEHDPVNTSQDGSEFDSSVETDAEESDVESTRDSNSDSSSRKKHRKKKSKKKKKHKSKKKHKHKHRHRSRTRKDEHRRRKHRSHSNSQLPGEESHEEIDVSKYTSPEAVAELTKELAQALAPVMKDSDEESDGALNDDDFNIA